MTTKELMERWLVNKFEGTTYGDTLSAQTLKLAEALDHPDMQHLSCDCGIYEPTNESGFGIMHTCIKCYSAKALKEFREFLTEE